MRTFLCLLMLATASSLHAASDILWIAQVQARPSGEVDRAMRPYEKLFAAKFGVGGLELLDTEKEALAPCSSSEATFKGGYTMKVTCLQREITRYVVNLVLSDRDGQILETKVEIARDSPLILAGPETPEGRVMFLVDVR